MIGKWIGAIMIILGCGCFGYSMVRTHKQEEHTLRLLYNALDYMECEIRFRLTPLPELLLQTSKNSSGSVKQVLNLLAGELENQISADISFCVHAALAQVPNFPTKSREAMKLLGNTLGKFDINGQLMSLESVRSFCRRELDQLAENREARLKSYQTLGLCAGAALAILFV